MPLRVLIIALLLSLLPKHFNLLDIIYLVKFLYYSYSLSKNYPTMSSNAHIMASIIFAFTKDATTKNITYFMFPFEYFKILWMIIAMYVLFKIIDNIQPLNQLFHSDIIYNLLLIGDRFS